MSFGYGRAEVVAALVNYTTLVILALYLVYEGVTRFFDPEPVNGWMVVWIAAIALVVDLVTAALTLSMSRTSMNIRAAFLHNLADALGSVAVIAAGTLVILFGWVWVDPLVTLMIAGYILWHVWSEIGGVIRVLMMGSPPHLDTEQVVRSMEAVEGVESVHHMHLWSMQEHDAALEAHVVVRTGDWEQVDRIRDDVKSVLAGDFRIHHSTLEMEDESRGCRGSLRIGHE